MKLDAMQLVIEHGTVELGRCTFYATEAEACRMAKLLNENVAVSAGVSVSIKNTREDAACLV